MSTQVVEVYSSITTVYIFVNNFYTGGGVNGRPVESDRSGIAGGGSNLGNHFVGPVLIAIGQPWIPKPFVTPGSSPGTSIVSNLFSKLLIKSSFRLPTIISNSSGTRIAWTNSLGRFAGRWVPIVGWALPLYDFNVNVALRMSEGNTQYELSNNKSGNWINNLPH